MLNFANMQLAVRLLFVSQFLATTLSATRFLPETCAWHREQYREQQCIADAQQLENDIRANCKHAFIAASMLAQAHAEQFAVNTHTWPALNAMVLRDAMMSIEWPLYRQVKELRYAVGQIDLMIKKIDMQTLDGAHDKPWQIAQKKRLKDVRRILRFIYGHMVQTEQYQREKASFKIMKKT